mgnify:FL=1
MPAMHAMLLNGRPIVINIDGCVGVAGRDRIPFADR